MTFSETRYPLTARSLALTRELEDQATHPPGKDLCIGTFYQAILDMSATNHRLAELINYVFSQRPITEKHFVNLLFRTVQFIELFRRGNDAYRYFVSPAEWKLEIEVLLQEHAQELKALLFERNTTTTKYQRYLGPKALIAHMYAQTPTLQIADFGCGGNEGLTGFIDNRPFNECVDETDGAFVTTQSTQKLPIARAYAIDQENPYDRAAAEWRFACSHYPSEFGNDDTRPTPTMLHKPASVSFIQGDITTLPIVHEAESLTPGIPVNTCDAVILSTMLYQHNKASRKAILEKARASLHANGSIIIQDFARKAHSDRDYLSFDTSWFEGDYSYRTFISSRRTQWQMLEVLQWKNGRCTHVRNGEDFHIYATLFDTIDHET